MDDQFITRNTLLQRVLGPDGDDAWKEFVSYYESFIFMLLRGMNVPAADCEDIAQNVQVRIWQNLEKYQASRAKFRTWLTTIIRNECYTYYDQWRRLNRKHEALKNDINPGWLADEAFEQLVEREWSVYVTNLAMQRVEKQFAGNAIEVFKLTLDGLDAHVIAERLDIVVSTVYALRNRVKQKLVEEVKRLRQELER